MTYENTETITLIIQKEKKEAFLEMLKLFDFVEPLLEKKTEQELEDGLENAQFSLNPSFEEIQAIASHFPDNYQWTYQDLQTHFPKDLKISVQVIQNQLFIMPSPSLLHQSISEELTFQMGTFLRKHKLGKLMYAPMDVKFDEDNVTQPDILFVAISRYEILGENNVRGVPDLVVKIWSPANKKKERTLKNKLYQQQGVTEYWQIFPKKKEILIEVLNENQEYEIFSQAKKEGKVRSKVLEGFELSLEDIFESL
jgi:Uma2 family endonuclease